MLTFACVLRSGGDYVPEDAIILSRQVYRNLTIPHKFICLTNMDFYDPYVETVALINVWPGWWSLIETFRLTGPVIVTGLDTLIIDDINQLGELALTCRPDQFYMTRPQPYSLSQGEKMCSGVMMWNGNWSFLREEFKSRYIAHFRKEQRYTAWKLEQHKVDVSLLQDHFTGFYSWKNDCKEQGVPDDARIVAFHGKPRPRQCSEKWVQELLQDYSIPEHHLADVVAKEYA